MNKTPKAETGTKILEENHDSEEPRKLDQRKA